MGVMYIGTPPNFARKQTTVYLSVRVDVEEVLLNLGSIYRTEIFLVG